MQSVPAGLSRTGSFTPTADDTAAAVGNAGVEAVATVTMILWVEEVCGSLVASCLDDGEASVGFRVAVDHTGPAFPGRPVDVRATVRRVSGRRITFAVALTQEGREVMAGEHVRAVVDLAAFLDRPEARTVTPPAPVTFFFDVHSPWSYLASMRIASLARRHDAEVIWRPLHLANLMERIGGMRSLEQNRARVAWYRQDIADRMAEAGLAYDPHPDYPLRPSRALRACVYAAEQGCAEAFVQALMRGYWAEGMDISDLSVLQDIADAVGLGPRPIAEIAADEACKGAVAANTDDAIAAGVFGVPSFLFQGKVFFGSDRMDLLDRALARAARN